VDGNHVGGTMDLLHLVDLDLGVHLGGSVPRHLPDVDHLVLHLRNRLFHHRYHLP
jgi:hypothetical protein